MWDFMQCNSLESISIPALSKLHLSVHCWRPSLMLLPPVNPEAGIPSFTDSSEIGSPVIDMRVLREAGFTEQRTPPTPNSGGITGCCTSSPLHLLNIDLSTSLSFNITTESVTLSEFYEYILHETLLPIVSQTPLCENHSISKEGMVEYMLDQLIRLESDMYLPQALGSVSIDLFEFIYCAVFGTEIWPAEEYGRTMYTIRQRVGPLLMRVQKIYGQIKTSGELTENEIIRTERTLM
ncbi:hypothetical protein L195_g014243 [Trifolium pratense]|uniref:Uncharacterized protein n=1 Tax=Trifolium pratense TaxID=57577 RepID=A0A2K3PQD8_TRIPR|nr:hypothetical protein L195_g014243 [Trifolium pratense]